MVSHQEDLFDCGTCVIDLVGHPESFTGISEQSFFPVENISQAVYHLPSILSPSLTCKKLDPLSNDLDRMYQVYCAYPVAIGPIIVHWDAANSVAINNATCVAINNA